MYKKKGTHRIEIRENARGGKGKIMLQHLMEKEELLGHGRLCAMTTINPDCSMGYHIHEGEIEFFLITKGVAKIVENGKEILLYPGDTLYTDSNEGHSLEPAGDECIEYFAIILSKDNSH
jgi:mannose-6-phosphate isomerase-like protein (cupin superfamily)